MGMFNCPVENARLTSPFGWRTINNKREWHQGCDLASAGNVPIYAAADGVVSRVGALSTYGNVVMIKHVINNKQYETNHAHLKSWCVEIGQKVKKGQRIGIMGATGRSYGIHLHFEIHQPSYAPSQPYAKNPMDFIQLNTCVPLGSSQKTETKTPSIDYSKKIGYSIQPNSLVYRIHTDKFKSKRDAQIAQNEFVKQGYLKYAETFGNDKDGYRLKSGKYTCQKDAELASKKMLDDKVIGYASIIGTKE